MSLIKNLVKEPETKPYKGKKGKADGDEAEDEKKPRPIIKSATDLQRLKLEKLMKNPDKPIIIPEAPREKDYMQTVPSFVRNVMGSSAGAGSGEFHVYRHLRRKEYARQKTIQAKSVREQLDDAYQQKLETNRMNAEEKTAKKRAKRLKRKQRVKKPKLAKNEDDAAAAAEDDNSEEETSDVEEPDDKRTEENEPAKESEKEDNVDGKNIPVAAEDNEEEESSVATVDNKTDQSKDKKLTNDLENLDEKNRKSQPLDIDEKISQDNVTEEMPESAKEPLNKNNDKNSSEVVENTIESTIELQSAEQTVYNAQD